MEIGLEVDMEAEAEATTEVEAKAEIERTGFEVEGEMKTELEQK